LSNLIEAQKKSTSLVLISQKTCLIKDESLFGSSEGAKEFLGGYPNAEKRDSQIVGISLGDSSELKNHTFTSQ